MFIRKRIQKILHAWTPKSKPTSADPNTKHGSQTIPCRVCGTTRPDNGTRCARCGDDPDGYIQKAY